MIKVKTESGSAYEIDEEKKLIRRLFGSCSATARQGADGAWKEYSILSSLKVGESLVIVWTNDVPLLGNKKEIASQILLPSTITSPIIKIEGI